MNQEEKYNYWLETSEYDIWEDILRLRTKYLN